MSVHAKLKFPKRLPGDMENVIIANVFGTFGAVCWSVQLLPQIIINYRRHNAIGLQAKMMMFWAWAGVPLGVYNIVSGFNVALQIQPQVLSFLSLLTWMQCCYYEKGWTFLKACAVAIPIACLMGGIEVALILAIRVGQSSGIAWPITLMAVLAALFLALGVLSHYVDIYRHRTVRGISFLFVGIDALGDLTSIISVAFQPSLDILGLVIYGIELALWTGVFICGGYFNLIPWINRKFGRNLGHRDAVSYQDNVAPGMGVHDAPSSTSVFRTPSSDIELRSRANVAHSRSDESS